MARRGGNRIFGILIVLILAGGLAGFGTRVLQGSTTASLGTVGGLDVTAQEYVNAYQTQLQRLSQQFGTTLTAATARNLNLDLDRSVLAGLVTQRALDAEAERLGLSVGDARVAAAVRSNPAFQGLTGEFDRAAYRDALSRNGLGIETYEDGLRRDQARSILQAAILTGLPEPTVAAETLAAWQGEQRVVTWALLSSESVAPTVAAPDAAAVQAWYDAHPDAYTAPEVRRVTYAWATPETVAPSLDVDEARVRELYEQRKADFVQEERRLVERVVLDDDAQAADAKARIDAGSLDFEGLVAERGLALSDVDIGDQTRGDLGDAGEAIFAAQPGDVLGPLPSPFGPALYRVNAVLAADETPFEEVEAELRDELAADDARRAIADAAAQVQDLVAGGASIDDIAERTMLDSGTLDYAEGVSDGPAAYAPVREAIAAADPGDLPEAVDLDDGGLAVIAVTEVVPPALRPFEEVADQVAADALADAVRAATLAAAEAKAAAIAGGASFEDQGLQPVTETPRTRRDVIEGAPEGTVAEAFGMEAGEARALPAPEGALVLRVDSVVEAAPDDERVVADRAQVADQLSSSLSQDLFTAFADRLQAQTEVRIDQGLAQSAAAQIP